MKKGDLATAFWLNLVVLLQDLQCGIDGVRDIIGVAGHFVAVEVMRGKTAEQYGEAFKVLDSLGAIHAPHVLKSSPQVIFALQGIKLCLHGFKALLPDERVNIPIPIGPACKASEACLQSSRASSRLISISSIADSLLYKV